MPTNIRILLTAMFAFAGLIAAGFLMNISDSSGLGASILGAPKTQQGTIGPADFGNRPGTGARNDLDKDGLFDREEPIYRTDPLNPDTDGDGFLDGEEVASGCSPILPSPDDCKLKGLKSAKELNLTDYFGALIAGGVLSYDLDKSNPDFQKYVSLLNDEVSNIKKVLLSVDDSELDTNISLESSKRSSQEYLNGLEKALRRNFLKPGPKAKIEKIADFDFSPYLKDLSELKTELSGLKPPINWMETHKELLKLVVKLEAYLNNLSKQEDDPVRALLSLDNTGNLLSEYDELTGRISEKIKKEGLKTDIFH